MTSALALSSRHRADDVVVSLTGELDLSAAPRVSEALQQHRAGGLRVVLDLSGLTFMDSSGIGVILEAHRLAPEAIAFVTPTGQPLRALQLCGLMDLLPWAAAGAPG